MGYGYEGDRIRLVPIDRDKHLANCQRWMNDPEVTDWLTVGYYPLTMEAETDWFEQVSRSNGRDVVFAIETLEGEHIGQSGVHSINLLHGTATTGSFIGRSDLRGQGIGTEAAHMRSRYCFEVLNLRMLYSGYLATNVRSARMQEKAGYQISGTVPNAIWKNGQYHDMRHTYLTREQWMEMQEKRMS